MPSFGQFSVLLSTGSIPASWSTKKYKTKEDFLPGFRFIFSTYHPNTTPYLSTNRGWYNRLTSNGTTMTAHVKGYSYNTTENGVSMTHHTEFNKAFFTLNT